MKALALLLLLLLSLPASAQKGMDLLVDIEGVRRTGTNEEFTDGQVRFEPRFTTGGGLGAGINLFLSGRVSVEGKVAGLGADLVVRVVGSDYVATSKLGRADIYPIMATLQWHALEQGAIRPYVGIGVAHIILRNIEDVAIAGGATGIRFDDPTGILLNAGVRLRLSSRWSGYADARYIPIETDSEAQFVGTASAVRLQVKPVIVAFGIAYRF